MASDPDEDLALVSVQRLYGDIRRRHGENLFQNTSPDGFVCDHMQWITQDGRHIDIRDMTDNHLNNSILFLLNGGSGRAAQQKWLPELSREQLRRHLGPWSLATSQLIDAVIDGDKCAFALHDALIEEGFDNFAEFFSCMSSQSFVQAVYLVAPRKMTPLMLKTYEREVATMLKSTGKVLPFQYEWSLKKYG